MTAAAAPAPAPAAKNLRGGSYRAYVGRMSLASIDLIAATLLTVAWIVLVRRDRQVLGAGAYYAAATLALLGLTAG